MDSVEQAMSRYFFCGIGGSGMNPLAQALRARGSEVSGSDRSFDRGENEAVREALEAQGIRIWPQDGSGVRDGVDQVVVSSAVEPTIPDVKAALEADVPVRKRAELLAELCNGGDGVAIGGTSGKSTVTAMVGHILSRAGREPTVINGAVMLNAVAPPFLGNAICGTSPLVVIEADESDGTIELYRPLVGTVTNISLDHKPMDELHALFRGFSEATKGTVVLNHDCDETRAMAVDLPASVRRLTFGFEDGATFRAEAVELMPGGSSFAVKGTPFELSQIGLHNVANALAATATCVALDVPLRVCAEALATFAGVERRLQVIGSARGVTVVDDFGHNPEKIAASLAALKQVGGRLMVMYQPHGFGPTRFLRAGLVKAFAEGLGPDDQLAMPEIFYAGGTAQKDISSLDLVREIVAAGRQAHFIADREAIPGWLAGHAREGDTVVIMGARDPGLTPLARRVLALLGDGDSVSGPAE